MVPVLNQGAQMRGEGGWDQGGSGRGGEKSDAICRMGQG